MQKRH